MNPIATPRQRLLIAPSVLAADFARMGDDCRDAMAAGADLLHLDVMDGHFVPNLTMGPDLARDLRRALPDAAQDVHLMVTDPVSFAVPFLDVGADHITFHMEVLDLAAARELARFVRGRGKTVGVAINPPTPVDRVLPYVEFVDLVLVMSVNPGFAGQSFIREVLPKVARIRQSSAESTRIEIDGGISPATAPEAIAAGCDTLVMGSAFFRAPSRIGVVEKVRTAFPHQPT